MRDHQEAAKADRASANLTSGDRPHYGGNPFADYEGADSEYAYFEELRDLPNVASAVQSPSTSPGLRSAVATASAWPRC